MDTKVCWESFKAEAATVAEKVKKLVHEGNVRRIVVEQRGHTIAEFPLTAGVLSIMLAPVLAAIGAIVALLKDCTIHVDRTETAAAAAPAAPKTDARTPVDIER